MEPVDARTLPLDARSRESLIASGLDYRLDEGPAGHDAHLRAVARGFLDKEPSEAQLADGREILARHRVTGVYDSTALEPELPVGTVESWVSALTLPGGAEVPHWAISDVTVAGTHRRRGIARAMLEGELRTAAAAGVPVAGLTVSEATIYERYGFGPAVFASEWSILVRRAGWRGPETGGRLDFIGRDRLREELAVLHERVRRSIPGEIAVEPERWARVARTTPGAEEAGALRAVRYADDEGVTRGVLSYTLTENLEDFAESTLRVDYLLAEDAAATAALWRYALQHDLVRTVTASRLAAEAPLRWLLRDPRAARVVVGDHHWLRVLDPARLLRARLYPAAFDGTVRVEDPLGLADGAWRLRTSGPAEAAFVDEAAPAEADVVVDVSALSSVLLGGTRLAGLAAAGRVRGDTDAVRALDAALCGWEAPRLTLGY